MIKSKKKLEHYWNELIKDRSLSSEPATMESYNTSWKIVLKPFWAKLGPKDITAVMVGKFENWYLEKFPTRSFFNARKHLVMLFNHMKKVGMIKNAPEIKHLDEIIIKRTKKKKVGRVYTDDELVKLISYAPIERNIQLAITMLAKIGMRKMELLTLKWDAYNMDKKELTIWSFKNKKYRTIPVPEDICEILGITYRKNEYVFPDALSHLKAQTFDNVWRRTKRLAGITGVARVHDLRHTFASKTAAAGWPPLVACEWLDMSLPIYSKTYCHISIDDMRKAAIK
jgi:integrase